MHSGDSDPAKNQSIEDLKATIAEIDKTIVMLRTFFRCPRTSYLTARMVPSLG